jgi:hypothetical protein
VRKTIRFTNASPRARSGAGTIHIEPARRHGQCIIHCYSRLAGNKIKSSTQAGKHHDHYFTLLVVFCLRSCRRHRRRDQKLHATRPVCFFTRKETKMHIQSACCGEFLFENGDAIRNMYRYISIKRAAAVTAR